MLTNEEIKRIKVLIEELNEQGDELKEKLKHEIVSITASIDENIQHNHIVAFQEIVSAQTIITLSIILTEALLNGKFKKESEDGVVTAIDFLKDYLAEQSIIAKMEVLGAHLADQGFLDMLEEDNKWEGGNKHD